jgi:hypothetical protein
VGGARDSLTGSTDKGDLHVKRYRIRIGNFALGRATFALNSLPPPSSNWKLPLIADGFNSIVMTIPDRRKTSCSSVSLSMAAESESQCIREAARSWINCRKYESRQISGLNVRVYGDTAVVTGRSIQKGTENAKDYSGSYRFTRVYIKQNGAGFPSHSKRP